MAEITQEQLGSFLDGLSDDQRIIVESLLSTIALQAESIRNLTTEVQIHEGADALMAQAISTVSLTQLAANLNVVQGPTLEEINQSITEMNQAIESAASAREVFGTILQFGVKLAPLAL